MAAELLDPVAPAETVGKSDPVDPLRDPLDGWEPVLAVEPAGWRVFDGDLPTGVVDSSVWTCGTDPAVAALGPAELVPGDPSGHLLATTSPGPRLAGWLEVFDPGTLPDPVLVEYLAACERLKAWCDARAVAATAELTGRCARLRGVGPGADQLPAEQVAAAELAAALAVSPTGARNRVELAAALTRLPGTRWALAAGRIDLAKARAVVDAVAVLADPAARAVEARVLPRAGAATLPALRQALRRAVISADPAAAQACHAAARAARGVWREPLTDGMARLEWVAPAEQVEAGYLWITGLADRARAGDRDRARTQRAAGQAPDMVRTLDACRSDVLADLAAHALAAMQLPRRHGRAPQIGVVVAASTLLGADDDPAELAGTGHPITAEVARRIAADGLWRRLLTDPAGRLCDISADTYQPTQPIRDFVLARDATCHGIGCRTPATRCDLDHTVEWPCGPTSPANLHPLCRAEHRLKTLTDTTITSDGHGGLVWTMPSGRRYDRPAQPLLDHPALVGAATPARPDAPDDPDPPDPPTTEPDEPPF